MHPSLRYRALQNRRKYALRQIPGIIVFIMAPAGHVSLAAISEDAAPGNIRELESRIRQTLEMTKTPGASVAVVTRGRELWTAGIGKADLSDGTQATADTLVRFGSITKSFVALSVMMLVEGGRLSLDDHLRMLALNSRTSETAWRPAYFSPNSAGLFVLSLILPSASLLGLVASMRAARNGMAWRLWLFTLFCSLSACLLTAYLGYYDVIGIRTWHLEQDEATAEGRPV